MSNLFTDPENGKLIDGLAARVDAPFLSRLRAARAHYVTALKDAEAQRVALTREYAAADAALAVAETRLDAARAEVASLREKRSAVSTEHVVAAAIAEAGVTDEDIVAGEQALADYKAFLASIA